MECEGKAKEKEIERDDERGIESHGENQEVDGRSREVDEGSLERKRI